MRDDEQLEVVMVRTGFVVGGVVGVLVAASAACGQSLFVQGADGHGGGEQTRQGEVRGAGVLEGPDGQVQVPLQRGAALQETSLLAIEMPRPRTFERHGQVSIIVDEVSRQQAEQSLRTDKTYDIDANLDAVIDPWKLLEARLRQADIDRLRLIDAGSRQRFDGKGRYERQDRFTMKIQATIIDVKPNGVLVLEARKTIDKNGELTTTVLSGTCRQEDVTGNNTIFSSQLADLTLITRQEGEVDKAARKGLIPRVLETIFAF